MKSYLLFFVAFSLLFAGCSQLPEHAAEEVQTSVTITVSIDNGTLVYSDDSGQQGQSILTSAGYCATIVWKADVASGVKDITAVNLDGDLFMFSEKPQQLSPGVWAAKVASEGEGTISYTVEVPNAVQSDESTDDESLKAVTITQGIMDTPPPGIRIP
jgi:hypothetical protein